MPTTAAATSPNQVLLAYVVAAIVWLPRALLMILATYEHLDTADANREMMRALMQGS